MIAVQSLRHFPPPRIPIRFWKKIRLDLCGHPLLQRRIFPYSLQLRDRVHRLFTTAGTALILNPNVIAFHDKFRSRSSRHSFQTHRSSPSSLTPPSLSFRRPKAEESFSPRPCASPRNRAHLLIQSAGAVTSHVRHTTANAAATRTRHEWIARTPGPERGHVRNNNTESVCGRFAYRPSAVLRSRSPTIWTSFGVSVRFR